MCFDHSPWTGSIHFLLSVFILILQVAVVTGQNRKGGVTGRYGRGSFGSGVLSTLFADHLAHHLPARGLQWSHAAAREEPHALILIAAVNNVDAVAHNCVVERGAGILSD